MRRLGQKTLQIELAEAVEAVPEALSHMPLTAEGGRLVYSYDSQSDHTGITGLLNEIRDAGLQMTDLQTRQSSLEEIFVSLVKEDA
jgi:ABC-2 type transport system ATP-binding protein